MIDENTSPSEEDTRDEALKTIEARLTAARANMNTLMAHMEKIRADINAYRGAIQMLEQLQKDLSKEGAVIGEKTAPSEPLPEPVEKQSDERRSGRADKRGARVSH